MEEKYETISIDEKEVGPFISLGTLRELEKILKSGECYAYLGSPDFEELKEKIKGYDLKQIRDYRGKFILYLKSGKEFIKLSLEPQALEELLGIKVAKEIVCKDFKGLVEKIQAILEGKELEDKTYMGKQKPAIDYAKRAQEIFEREFEEC